MNYYSFIVLFTEILRLSQGSGITPRGVPVRYAYLYKPGDEFGCFDGLKSIPFKFINDDYCDCSDGSDEPGTSACPNGVFFCLNEGYKSYEIPSSRVNDGICDCCDGSDEYLSGNCSDTCAILGAKAKEEAQRLAELMMQGSQMRLSMILAGKQLKQQKMERINALEIEKTTAEKLKEETEEHKKEAEERESKALDVYRKEEERIKQEKLEAESLRDREVASDVFNLIDTNLDGVLQKEELMAKSEFDQDKNGEVSEEEVNFYSGGLEEVSKDEFLGSVWPLTRQLFLRGEEPEETSEEVQDVPGEEEEGEGGEEGEEEHPQEDTEQPQEDADHAQEDADHAHEEPEVQYDETTKHLMAAAGLARTRFQEAERALRDLESELTKLKEFMEKDYGPEDEFAPLEGECFTFTDRNYNFKLCPFDHVHQSDVSGGFETRLGTWQGWQGTDYSTMLYDRGQSCWNGPQRSASIHVSCGLQNALISAAEPNKCEYVLEFETPAACRAGQTHQELHDEL